MSRTARKNKGVSFQFKATSGGTYAAIDGVHKFKLPRKISGTEDLTETDDDVEREGNTIVNYSDLELEITRDDEDTVHIAMNTAVGGDDCYVKATLANGRTIEYVGNAKEFPDVEGTAKNYQRSTFKMHPNATPTEVAPP